MRGEEWDRKDRADFLKEVGNGSLFAPFLEELTLELQRRLGVDGGDTPDTAATSGSGGVSREEPVPSPALRRWNELIRDSYRRWETYNQSAEVLLETLYYDMEESLEAVR
jgi:hypothetical protein